MGKWIAVLVALFMPVSARAQEDRPLRTETAELLGIGAVRAEFGIDFLHRQRYSLSGLEGDLLRLGVTTIRVGAGEYAEFQISGVARDFLTVNRRSPAVIPPTFAGGTTSDFGDLILGTKLKLAGEKGARPALAFSFAVQLPNASNESGLGTDQTEFYSKLLLTKHLGKVAFRGNLGLAILGSPVQPNSQADLLTYGFAILAPVHAGLELVGEVRGRQGPLRIGNENMSRVQLGARVRMAGLLWEIAGVAGLRRFDPGSGLLLGVTYDFQAFHRKRGPVTIR